MWRLIHTHTHTHTHTYIYIYIGIQLAYEHWYENVTKLVEGSND